MTYVKASVLALLIAVVVGAASGVGRLLVLAVGSLHPEDKAAVLSQSISEAMNCAALLATPMIPLGLIVAYVVRRRRQGARAQPK